LEENEGIFGTKFGVSLGITVEFLFQKCPHELRAFLEQNLVSALEKQPDFCSKNTLILFQKCPHFTQHM
jgi:hypothetical protein